MISRSSLEPLMAGVLACLLMPTSAVVARPFATTHYEYYSVSGMSAASLHRSLEVHGPQVGGYIHHLQLTMRIRIDFSSSTCRDTNTHRSGFLLLNCLEQ